MYLPHNFSEQINCNYATNDVYQGSGRVVMKNVSLFRMER